MCQLLQCCLLGYTCLSSPAPTLHARLHQHLLSNLSTPVCPFRQAEPARPYQLRISPGLLCKKLMY